MKEYLVGEVVNIWWTLDSLDALCLQTSSKKGTRDWCADDLVSEETMAKVSTVNSSRTFADNTCYLVITGRMPQNGKLPVLNLLLLTGQKSAEKFVHTTSYR